MKVITKIEIKQINELYAKYGTYAAVAREMKISPATVKKYIVDNYEPVNEQEIIRFDRPLPPFDPTIFRSDDWGPLCVLSDEEIEEIKILWKEIDV